MLGFVRSAAVKWSFDTDLRGAKSNSLPVQKEIASYIYERLGKLIRSGASENEWRQVGAQAQQGRHALNQMGNQSHADPLYARFALLESAVVVLFIGDEKLKAHVHGELFSWFKSLRLDEDPKDRAGANRGEDEERKRRESNEAERRVREGAERRLQEVANEGRNSSPPPGSPSPTPIANATPSTSSRRVPIEPKDRQWEWRNGHLFNRRTGKTYTPDQFVRDDDGFDFDSRTPYVRVFDYEIDFGISKQSDVGKQGIAANFVVGSECTVDLHKKTSGGDMQNQKMITADLVLSALAAALECRINERNNGGLMTDPDLMPPLILKHAEIRRIPLQPDYVSCIKTWIMRLLLDGKYLDALLGRIEAGTFKELGESDVVELRRIIPEAYDVYRDS